MNRLLAVVLIAAVAGACAGATPAWPQFHGPNRDNRSAETGLLKRWPEGGPRLLWTATGLGEGFATVAIAGDRIYTAGNLSDATVITALDLAGKTLWRTPNGAAGRHDYPGSRGTPTLDGDRLYHESPNGDIVCLDAATGRRVWGLNMLETFGGRNIRWGLAESLLVDGDRVICVPGGEKVAMAALDKKTGQPAWTCPGTGDKPGYASPILIDHKGLRQIVTMMSASVVGVHAETGALLWRHDHKAYEEETVSTPVFHDGLIAVATLGPGAARCLRLIVDGQTATVEQVWHTAALDNHHGGILALDGYLYGTKVRGTWVCLDFKTGEPAYTAKGVGKGSLTYADGMLYTYSEKGLMGLVKATPESHELVSQFQIPEGGKGLSWPHPVVCGGRLYLRHGDLLFCYDVRAESSG
ncbi:MAG: PQQ-like beta-propeller repeat protein [Planctomycetes bacterium]|nr:PQQ-like beta-propeller repeat protein [Planctomycetota bacterium]